MQKRISVFCAIIASTRAISPRRTYAHVPSEHAPPTFGVLSLVIPSVTLVTNEFSNNGQNKTVKIGPGLFMIGVDKVSLALSYPLSSLVPLVV